jgi:SAM-dependent methyltransferase
VSSLWFRLRRAARRAREIQRSRSSGGPACANCGFRGRPLHKSALWPELVAQWELSPQWAHWMDEREGSRCAWCGSSLRSAGLAGAIVAAVNTRHGTHAKRLRSLFRDPRARSLSIAEINSAGNLHRVLSACPGLRYSEFGSRTPGVPSQDLTALTYKDASFDMVVTSDTLEHVPDIDRALAEIRRVLKPGGAHVFTTPVVWDRPTRQRARIEGGRVVHLLPPSHHGDPKSDAADFLVFYEFGADFPDRCARAGYELELRRDADNPALVTFIARRPA